ncbi:MAG TPA: futalosine hydrolase [Edaphocola sp.]|nr:futalosine hydrolase [Edaphocola sp.]
MKEKVQRLLIVSATQMEIAPSLSALELQLQEQSNDILSYCDECLHVDFLISGVGMLETCFHLQKQLLSNDYDFVIQVGVAGLYPGAQLPLASLVWVRTDNVADLGAIDADGIFLSSASIGLSGGQLLGPSPEPPLKWQKHFSALQHVCGSSVNCLLGQPNFKTHLPPHDYPAVVESMEGAALHLVCERMGIPYAQIRSISNMVEPRDKSKWKMKEAIQELNNWLIRLISNTSEYTT